MLLPRRHVNLRRFRVPKPFVLQQRAAQLVTGDLNRLRQIQRRIVRIRRNLHRVAAARDVLVFQAAALAAE